MQAPAAWLYGQDRGQTVPSFNPITLAGTRQHDHPPFYTDKSRIFQLSGTRKKKNRDSDSASYTRDVFVGLRFFDDNVEKQVVAMV